VDIFTFVGQEWLLITVLFALIALLIIVTRKDGGLPIAASELVQLMNREEAILVDVRPTNDFNAGHVFGAINMPHSQLTGRLSELEKYRDKLIVVADQMGQHAGSAGKLLKANDYQVRRLSGGISGWQQNSLPLVRGGKG
jgi:rhodanese-related sulfurtransferase